MPIPNRHFHHKGFHGRVPLWESHQSWGPLGPARGCFERGGLSKRKKNLDEERSLSKVDVLRMCQKKKK